MKTILLSTLFLIAGFSGQSQNSNSNKPFTRDEIQKDYLIFRKAMETTYPSLYRFTDSVNMTQYLNYQFSALDRSMNALEFYKTVVLACARVNDEHLIPTPPGDYYELAKGAHHYFPFSLKIFDRRMFIYKGYKLPTALPVASEILSINGHSVEDILNTLLPTIPSDGYIQNFNIRHLEDYSMTQNQNLFDLNYPIFIEDTDSFTIEFIHPASKSEKQIIRIDGLDYKEYRKFYDQRIGYKAPLESRFIKNDIAYLRISSFLEYHRKDFNQDFYSLYDSIFKQLNQHKTKNLILDLRNNEGGDGTGEKLLTYLLTKPYGHFDFTEEKFTGYPAVVDYLENGKDLFFVDSIVYRTNTGMFRLKKEYYNLLPLLTEQQPAKNHFKGKLFVLMNGASGSMASVVASILKANQRAVFIGEESGGTMEGNTSLAYARLLLPNTKIRIEIPLTKTGHHATYIKGRGVFPDYYVSPTIEELIKGIDTELNFTLDLIAKDKSK